MRRLKLPAVRTLSTLILTLRLLLVSAVVYNSTRFLPADARSRLRYQATRRGAARIADYCLQKGGIFLKAAQYLSTVSNLFDTEFTEIFAGVPDRAEARPYEEIRYRFQSEFGREPEAMLLEFDRKPLAAASLGQVHVGRTKDGRKVAIKLLHPNMETLIRQDLRALRYVVRLILWFYGHLDFRGHLSEFANMVQLEIDYENEAESMRRARDQWKDEPRIIVPAVIDELSRSTVLTTEYIEGVSINDLDRLDRLGINRRTVAELLLESYARMVLSHRFYHADPHPGNIFVIPSNSLHPIRLAFVDFGATQDVTERTLTLLRRFLQLARARDIPGMVDLALEAEMLAPEADREVYTNLFELIHARYGSFKVEDYYRINPVRFGRVIKIRDLQTVGLRLREVISQIKLPRRYIYLGRTITMLISQAMRLDDRVNVFLVAKPHVDRYIGRRRGGVLNFIRTRAANVAALLDDRRRAAPLVSRYDELMKRRMQHRIATELALGGMAVALGGLATVLYIFQGTWPAAYALYGALGALVLYGISAIRRVR